jgi:ketosteroid isomerase-like protein
MSASDNTKVVQEAYAAFGGGDIPGLLAKLDENVEWTYPAHPAIPWAGEFKGHDGVLKFVGAIGESVDFLAFEPRTFIAEGDKVVVLGYQKMRNKASGEEWDATWAHVFTLKDGRVTSFREYPDTAAVAKGFA